ncbi:hypothetical protein KIF53_18045 [Chromobacterium subtsugae]|uniref:Holin n=2 Tax=Chromobacterium TaxID=535 RepID=A0ABS7FHT2_9NEIS|nr:MULTISPECIES: hypothetical protein [Chromobacterium]KUM02284.1 hypothetical protein Cv017_03955 [Chromobacterium subtsugae]KZE86239.1 hypothetical protein AWB61_17020 [Chromobacterium sp. F49]MBW7568085.1 hypothetical protein [Chromobacterium subtsugae]MBW8289541.1 hypothetical protein [Chromobacterium subtsugae]OBU86235.1 hypothetical protein MY55_11190 [Chromobacterium subtsugae]
MRLSDLVRGPHSRRLSHSRLWANVACAAATAMFVVDGWRGTLTPDLWLIYLGVVGGYSASLRLISAYRGRSPA